jgi:hypothetical protein
MTRTFAVAAVLFAAMAPVAANAATYSAKLATPVAAGKLIANDIRWSCGPDACRGSTADAPAMALCQGLAKKAGRVDSFVVNGRAFAAAELDKCNTHARASAGAQAVASAN